MKKYKGAFLSRNGLFFFSYRTQSFSMCRLKTFCRFLQNLSKRTSGLNSSDWGKLLKGELVKYIQMKIYKYDEYTYITLTLWITATKFASFRTCVFYTCDFQCFGNTKWLKYINYLTGNSQQVFLPPLKMILLASFFRVRNKYLNMTAFPGFFTPVSSYKAYQMAWQTIVVGLILVPRKTTETCRSLILWGTERRAPI